MFGRQKFSGVELGNAREDWFALAPKVRGGYASQQELDRFDEVCEYLSVAIIHLAKRAADTAGQRRSITRRSPDDIAR